jgi:hypothetical protein
MSRTDAQNVALLEKLRPELNALRSQRIKAEAEFERCERDLAEHSQTARELANSEDLEVIRDIVKNNFEKNSQAVDRITALRDEVLRELAELDKTA